jgi:hypothetical protein
MSRTPESIRNKSAETFRNWVAGAGVVSGVIA